MLYAFILGRVYTLSLAELLNLLEKLGVEYRLKTVASEIALIETDEPLNIEKIQAALGGTIKIVQIIETLNRKQKDFPSNLLEDWLDYKILKEKYLAQTTSKTQIGVSIYMMDPESRIPFSEPKRVVSLIKKYLVAQQISVRFVMPEPPSTYLPSVLVTKNNLLQKGAEFVLLVGRQNLSIGKTLSVQDFEGYGRRDYQRPFRDLKMGMLPPKVAQMMINLSNAKAGDTIFDPFCGGGTVLQEAILAGMSAVGSDISEDAVRGSEANLTWFRNRYHVPPNRYQVLKLDATSELEKEFKPDNFTSIVTEGWLGPLYTSFPTQEQIKQGFKELLEVYVRAFEQFKKVIEPGGKIVISFPAYKMGKDQYVFFPTLDFIESMGYSIDNPIPLEITEKYKLLKVTERKSIIYDRKDQIVAREIIVITKQ